nr:MAG TPA: integrase [Caudoviricetes sp.]
MNMIKGACYVRVSTDNQLENYSIEEQTDRLKAYCKAKDIQIVKIYTDGGYSGGNVNRPALQQMLQDIDKGLIDSVIVYKLDRLSRSQKDTLMLIEDCFLAKNVDFVSVNENFDTSTPFGRAMIGILSVFAQLEKDQITERFTMGRIGRAKNGYFHGGGNAPTGYDYIDGELIINDYEAIQVKDLYNRFLKGYSIHNCWQYMQQKYGGWSSEVLVRNVLKNELYIGKVKFKGVAYQGNHQPIISEETFRQVQDLFNSSRRASDTFKRSPFKASTLLSSLVYCGKCGARFHGEHGNYSCYSRTKGDKKYIVDPNCKNKKWKIEELDRLVLDYIMRLDFSKLKSGHPVPVPVTDYSIRLNEIDKQIGKLIDLYQVSGIPIETIQEKMDALNKEKEALLNISKPKNVPVTTLAEMITARDTLMSLSDAGSLDEKRACLTMIIDRIIIDDDNVNIKLKQL